MSASLCVLLSVFSRLNRHLSPDLVTSAASWRIVVGVAFISRLVISPVAWETGGNEGTEPADPPSLSHYLSHGLGKAATVCGDSSLVLPVCLTPSCLVELQPQQEPSPEGGK